ncbi:hypothetical protein E2320_001735 [Naja naja]|nr:hypothetical protein E2320_001735 [Naja naja]
MLNSTSSYQFTEMVFTITTVLDVVCTITFFFTKKSCKLCTEKNKMKTKKNRKDATRAADRQQSRLGALRLRVLCIGSDPRQQDRNRAWGTEKFFPPPGESAEDAGWGKEEKRCEKAQESK